MAVRIYPYKSGSASAKALAEALGIKRIKHKNSKYRPKQDDVIVNWGSSNLPDNLVNVSLLNDPDYVACATNKLSFFRQVDGAGCGELVVPWTTSDNQVQEWLSNGKTVVARTKLTGHSGEGVVLLEGAGAEIVEAPLYTLYVPKKDEYRVHCCLRAGGIVGTHPAVFDVQRKARKTGVPDGDVNWKVRNLGGGFIYAREGFTLPDAVRDVALRIFESTGLDFGAVDIIYNEKDNRAYALEINTAPGLSGTTLNNYVTMLKELIGG